MAGMAPIQYQCVARMPYWYADPAQPISSSEPRLARDKAQAGDPRGHLAAGHEELFAGVGAALEVEADPEHHREVETITTKSSVRRCARGFVLKRNRAGRKPGKPAAST